jgi:hypothetical protein
MQQALESLEDNRQVEGRRRRWQDSIKIDLREIGMMVWSGFV